MKTVGILLFFAVSIMSLRCEVPPVPAPPVDSAPLVHVDRATIYRLNGKKSGKVHVVDPRWFGELAVILDHATFTPRDHCFCVSYPLVELYDGNRLVLTLSVHHKDILRLAYPDKSRDFFVGEEIGAAIVKLALTPKEFAPPDPKSAIKPPSIALPPLPPIRAIQSL